MLNKKRNDANKKMKYAYKLKQSQKNIDFINNKIIGIKKNRKKIKKKLKI